MGLDCVHIAELTDMLLCITIQQGILDETEAAVWMLQTEASAATTGEQLGFCQDMVDALSSTTDAEKSAHLQAKRKVLNSTSSLSSLLYYATFFIAERSSSPHETFQIIILDTFLILNSKARKMMTFFYC